MVGGRRSAGRRGGFGVVGCGRRVVRRVRPAEASARTLRSVARDTIERDWSFARRPFWLFSHVFAVAVVVSFVLLGLWQLGRHGERADLNAVIAERSTPPAVPLRELDGRSSDDLRHRLVEVEGVFVDGDFVRVANRSLGGVAGEHVVAVFEALDGTTVLVNRGFVSLTDAAATIEAPPATVVTIEGWLQESAEQGFLGADDTGEGRVVPRLDVATVAARLDPASDRVWPLWLQLATDQAGADGSVGAIGRSVGGGAVYPTPVPLPPLDAGPHLGYMGQWFVFAVLGTAFYGALLWRTASGRQRPAPTPVTA